ncbi:dihydrodipicolinate synthase family protein [Anaerosinus massiliensis]|uniref:dihydrodipicolinate synthase family protein n=1 Tax=Massilibacillus massiliensis TaxID=1806837 RepID=UPI000B17C9AA|nr:dihydrodipicolinate synthase family protein [Massilibacillus massiliensis]
MLKGVITPVITVLDQQGKLDFEGNKLVIHRLIDQGVNGLLFLGSIGEFFAFTMDEKKEFIRFVVQTVDKRVPVLIGTGGTIQEDVIALTHFAETAGADGVVVISPYYFKLDSDTLYRYYANLARSTTMPIMIYNFPDRTAVNLEPQLVLKLAKEFNHIVAIKDTVDTISHTRNLIHLVKDARPEFAILSGYDEYLIPNLMAGGDGVIGGMSNVVPDVFSGILKAYKNQDFKAVTTAQKKISMLMHLYDISQPFVAAIKGAVAAQGVGIGAYVREPSGDLTEDQKVQISVLLEKVKKIE